MTSKLERLHRRLEQALPQLEIRCEEPMSRHTTFRVGGPAALMALPRSEEELVRAARLALELDVPPLCVGNGSNLLVDDKGIGGFVIKTVPSLARCEVSGREVTAWAGALMAQAATAAARAGLTGLEFAHGIPGSVGGGVTMNAGAYGGELCQVVDWVRAMDSQGQVHQLTNQQCQFRYRHTRFSDGDWVVLCAHMTLGPGDTGEIQARMEELMARRREKQPLEFGSAGSTFKRPEGHFAGALIEGCGLKGFTIGDAQVSEKHSGFVINRGHATCGDVLAVIEAVQERVFRETGVALEPEVKYVR